MNTHELIYADGRQYDEVRDEQGRFLALLDNEGSVILHSYYPPDNKVRNSSRSVSEASNFKGMSRMKEKTIAAS